MLIRRNYYIVHSWNTKYSFVSPFLTNEQRFFNSTYSEQPQSYQEVNAEIIRYMHNEKKSSDEVFKS